MLPFLSVQVCGLKYIHIVVYSLPPSTTLFHLPIETPYSLKLCTH